MGGSNSDRCLQRTDLRRNKLTRIGQIADRSEIYDLGLSRMLCFLIRSYGLPPVVGWEPYDLQTGSSIHVSGV